MAKLDLQPRKEFSITLDDGTVIKGQFGTWALKRYCDLQGYTLAQAGEHLGNPEISDITTYLLAAVEYTARKAAAPFSYNDVHCCSWIDELGGPGSEDLKRLFQHSADENKVKDDGEKKTDS